MAGARVRILREVEILARLETKSAIETLVSIMVDSEAPAAARVTAANSVLDRGWGKPQQNITVDNSVEHMSDDDLARNIERRIAAIASRAGQAGSGSGGDDAGDATTEGPEFASRVVH